MTGFLRISLEGRKAGHGHRDLGVRFLPEFSSPREVYVQKYPVRCAPCGERQPPQTFGDGSHIPTNPRTPERPPPSTAGRLSGGRSRPLGVLYQRPRRPCLQRKGGLPLPKWALHPVPLTPLGRIKKGEDRAPGFPPAVLWAVSLGLLRTHRPSECLGAPGAFPGEGISRLSYI